MNFCTLRYQEHLFVKSFLSQTITKHDLLLRAHFITFRKGCFDTDNAVLRGYETASTMRAMEGQIFP